MKRRSPPDPRVELSLLLPVISAKLGNEAPAQMSDTYIIEVSSQAAGIVVRETSGFRFFAASHRFNRLEGRLFRNAREAERAAMQFFVNGDSQIAG
jgi:hypothetical protein